MIIYNKDLVVTKENCNLLDRTKLTTSQKSRQTSLQKEVEIEDKKSRGIEWCTGCEKEFDKNITKTHTYCSFLCLFWASHNVRSPYYWNDKNKCLREKQEKEYIFWGNSHEGEEQMFTGRRAAYAVFHKSVNVQMDGSLVCFRDRECINPRHFKPAYTPNGLEHQYDILLESIPKPYQKQFESTLRTTLIRSIADDIVKEEHVVDVRHSSFNRDLLHIVNRTDRKKFYNEKEEEDKD